MGLINNVSGPTGYRDESGDTYDYNPETGNYVASGTANYNFFQQIRNVFSGSNNSNNQDMNEGNGEGFNNVAGGIGSILGGLGGNNGIGDDFAQVVTAFKNDPNRFPYGYNGNPYAAPGSNIPWGLILGVVGVGFAVYLITRKR